MLKHADDADLSTVRELKKSAERVKEIAAEDSIQHRGASPVSPWLQGTREPIALDVPDPTDPPPSSSSLCRHGSLPMHQSVVVSTE